MAKRELAGVAINEVEADGQDNVNPDAQNDVEVVGIHQPGLRDE